MLAAATIAGLSSVSASAYSLNYYLGAPSNINHLTTCETATSTGKGYITISTTKFYTKISGAYVSVGDSSPSTVPLTINSAIDQTLDYSGSYVPKSGVSVKVCFTLKDYVDSQSVEVQGSISA